MFVYPELNLLLTTEPFIQQGKPFEVKAQIEQPQPKPKPKESTMRKIWKLLAPSNQVKLYNEIEAIKAQQTTQERIEYPEEADHYPDSTDSDLIEFELDEE